MVPSVSPLGFFATHLYVPKSFWDTLEMVSLMWILYGGVPMLDSSLVEKIIQ